MEKLSEINDSKIRNSEIFKDYLESRGLTYADIYYILNGAGITEYNDILTKSGELVQGENGRYIGHRNFHSSDNGERTPEETKLDCEVGNIQEILFCLDNMDFVRNADATDKNVTKDSSITKKADLIHKPTGAKVEFKVSTSKLYGHDAYYRHRDGHVEEYLKAGNILLIYFINLDKVAIVTEKNFGKSFKVKVKDEFSHNKYWDVCTVWDGLFFNYKMMSGGNSEISKKISTIMKYRETK